VGCERILQMDVDVIVPGHGPITDKAGVRGVQEYLRFVDSEARKRFDAGMAFEEAARDIALGEFRNWTDYSIHGGRVSDGVGGPPWARHSPTSRQAIVWELSLGVFRWAPRWARRAGSNPRSLVSLPRLQLTIAHSAVSAAPANRARKARAPGRADVKMIRVSNSEYTRISSHYYFLITTP
jgi:hypothetical protein